MVFEDAGVQRTSWSKSSLSYFRQACEAYGERGLDIESVHHKS